jgi:hypothetical protein
MLLQQLLQQAAEEPAAAGGEEEGATSAPASDILPSETSALKSAPDGAAAHSAATISEADSSLAAAEAPAATSTEVIPIRIPAGEIVTLATSARANLELKNLDF